MEGYTTTYRDYNTFLLHLALVYTTHERVQRLSPRNTSNVRGHGGKGTCVHRRHHPRVHVTRHAWGRGRRFGTRDGRGILVYSTGHLANSLRGDNGFKQFVHRGGGIDDFGNDVKARSTRDGASVNPHRCKDIVSAIPGGNRRAFFTFLLRRTFRAIGLVDQR